MINTWWTLCTSKKFFSCMIKYKLLCMICISPKYCTYWDTYRLSERIIWWLEWNPYGFSYVWTQEIMQIRLRLLSWTKSETLVHFSYIRYWSNLHVRWCWQYSQKNHQMSKFKIVQWFLTSNILCAWVMQIRLRLLSCVISEMILRDVYYVFITHFQARYW